MGTLREVLDNYREHIFDGIVLEDEGGELRFVDAPEVARTAERGVTLTIDAAAVAQLPPPEKGPAGVQAAIRRPAVTAAGRRLEEGLSRRADTCSVENRVLRGTTEQEAPWRSEQTQAR